ncbi:energy transducer TonB [Hymenobacter negativus]|uniref:Energy transducer TonB n=1 Tax=Hymenobacter negativus TaxID=2795026 RepID=A0ABS3QJ12_9BACT|nr:energy transducer TonB [Hymenobacter negativus]MBO2011152.1 energy transducer TonB [Hymenobacter negativus]
MAAQSQKTASPIDTVYYNAAAERLPSRVGAARGIVTEPTATGMVQHIYNTTGHQLEQIPYSDKEGKVREGVALSWYPSGQLRGSRMYREGQLEGQMQAYYPNGTLRQLDTFEKGDSKSRLCYDANGKAMKCPTQLDASRVYARYRRGTLLLEEEVRHAVRRLPLPAGSKGERVIVACMVGVDGQIHQTHIYKSVGGEYDLEALRVVSTLRDNWTPELEGPEPVESYYMVNVDFPPLH